MPNGKVYFSITIRAKDEELGINFPKVLARTPSEAINMCKQLLEFSVERATDKCESPSQLTLLKN